MQELIFRFFKNHKLWKMFSVVAMTAKTSKPYLDALFKSVKFINLKTKCDYMDVLIVEDDEYIIARYAVIMLKRIEKNADRFGLSPCEKDNFIAMFQFISIEENALKRPCSAATICTHYRTAIKRFQHHKQKVNYNEKMLCILLTEFVD